MYISKLKKLSELSEAIREDYCEGAKCHQKMPHEYAIITHNCENNNFIFYNFMKQCEWERIVLKNKIIIINFHGEENFQERVNDFLNDFFNKNGYNFEISCV